MYHTEQILAATGPKGFTADLQDLVRGAAGAGNGHDMWSEPSVQEARDRAKGAVDRLRRLRVFPHSEVR